MTAEPTKELQVLIQKLIEFRTIQSQPKIMRECLAFCADFFKDLPVRIRSFEKNGIPSLVIEAGDVLPQIMLLGHIDVADGPDRLFNMRIEEGRIFGRGTSDMKGFVATSMIVLRDLLREGYKGSIGLALVTDEELGGQDGTQYLIENAGYRPKVVLVPDDGDDIGTVVTKSKHGFSFEFAARGKSAHGNRPWDGINAIEMLMETLSKLRTFFPAYTNPPESNWINTMNLGILSGGLAGNEVPAEAVMTVDIRTVPPTTRDEVLKAVESSLIPGVTSKLSIEVLSMSVDTENPYVSAYRACIEKLAGVPVREKQSGGATDARYFSATGSVAIVHQGTCGDAQGENEFVELSSLLKLIEIQKAFIKGKF